MFGISFFLRGLSKIDTSQIGIEQKNRIQILQTCRTKDILEKIIGKEYKLNNFAKLGFFGDNIENVWIKKKAQNREDAIKILKDIGISESNMDSTYNDIIK